MKNFITWVQENGFDFEFNTVLHLNNYFGIFKLADYLEKFSKRWYINVLTYPKHLDIIHMPEMDEFIDQVNNSILPNKEFIINHLRTKNEGLY